MILYHFTAFALINKIRSEGLTKGALPWNERRDGSCELRPGFQWLTSDPEWFAQGWCLMGNLPYARNSYRIAVRVPDQYWGRVIRWTDMAGKFRPDSAEVLNKLGGDTSKWYLYAGKIPPHWFLAVDRNPHEALRAEPNDIVT